MTQLAWFRSDLRVEDNPALHAACKAGEKVVGVFLVSRSQWRDHDWGANRINFTLRTAAALQDDLGKLGIPLLIREADWFADVPKTLKQIVKDEKADRLHYGIEHEVNEIDRDEKVTAALEAMGVDVVAHLDQTIYPVHKIRTQSDVFYKVFSPFARQWRSLVEPNLPVKVLSKPKKQGDPVKPKKQDDPLAYLVDGEAEQLQELWTPGTASAKMRLGHFIKDRVENYKKDRDIPSINGTSGLSPYLANGSLSPRVALAAALDANDGKLINGKKGIDTWINELVWREFYRHVLIGWPKVCRHQPFQSHTRDIQWRNDDAGFDAWCKGETGFPIVDAAMHQLVQTGWMHNRLRMVVAMFLTKDLLIDWRRGEEFFMNHLVDGDFASNNGGWQWAASTGTDAAPYFRIFNPTSQSEKFDKDGTFIRSYVPKLKDVEGKAVHDPPELVRASCDYPMPIVDHKPARLRAIDAFKANGD